MKVNKFGKTVFTSLLLTLAFLTPAHAKDLDQAKLAAIRKEAALGFDAPLYKKVDEAILAFQKGQATRGMALIDKCIEERPDCHYLAIERAKYLVRTGLYSRAARELEKAIATNAKYGDNFFLAYDLLQGSYNEIGERDKRLALLEKMDVLFPHSRRTVLPQLAEMYRRRHDKVNLNKTIAKIKSLPPPFDPNKSPMMALPPPTGHIAKGRGYEIIARTEPFARFKYTLNEAVGLGDNGASEYLQMAPDYNMIIVANSESHNCVKLTLKALLREFIAGGTPQPQYTTVKDLGKVKVADQDCDQYLCQWSDESICDLISVAPHIPLCKPLAHAMTRLADLPACNIAVLAVSRVRGGFVTPIYRAYSVKSVEFDTNKCNKIAGYHQLNSVSELIISGSEGGIKTEDTEKLHCWLKTLKTDRRCGYKLIVTLGADSCLLFKNV